MATDLKQLLIETHRGHEPSARALWNTQAPRLLHYARAIVVSVAEAEDVVQDVFCRVLQMARRDVERVNDPAAWLAQVARREAINHMRSRRRDSARGETANGLRLARGDFDAAPSTEAELQCIIDRLPRRLREVVVLKHVAGLTFNQIAHATGLNRNTAAARYRTAIETIKRQLGEEESTTRSGSVRSPAKVGRPVVQEVRHVG